MKARIAAILGLVLIGLSLGGCTKCGFIWDEAKSCRSDMPK